MQETTKIEPEIEQDDENTNWNNIPKQTQHEYLQIPFSAGY